MKKLLIVIWLMVEVSVAFAGEFRFWRSGNDTLIAPIGASELPVRKANSYSRLRIGNNEVVRQEVHEQYVNQYFWTDCDGHLQKQTVVYSVDYKDSWTNRYCSPGYVGIVDSSRSARYGYVQGPQKALFFPPKGKR